MRKPVPRIVIDKMRIDNASKEQIKDGIFIESIDKELLDETGNRYVLKIVCQKLRPAGV